MTFLFKIVFVIVLLSGCSYQNKAPDNIFLIPEGFNGSITIFYNVKSEPRLKKVENTTIIPVTEFALEALKDTDIYIYGAAFTSTPNMNYENANDKFYYVNQKGNRTTIDEKCIYYGGSGSTMGNKRIVYRELQITKTNCGQSFWFDGLERYHVQQSEVFKFWSDILIQ